MYGEKGKNIKYTWRYLLNIPSVCVYVCVFFSKEIHSHFLVTPLPVSSFQQREVTPGARAQNCNTRVFTATR